MYAKWTIGTVCCNQIHEANGVKLPRRPKWDDSEIVTYLDLLFLCDTFHGMNEREVDLRTFSSCSSLFFRAAISSSFSLSCSFKQLTSSVMAGRRYGRKTRESEHSPQCNANSKTCCQPEARRELPGCTCDVVIMWRAKQCYFFVCLLFCFVLLVLFYFIFSIFLKYECNYEIQKKKSSPIIVSLQISIFFFANFLLKKCEWCTRGPRLKCCHGACIMKWLGDMFSVALCLPSKINYNRYKTCGVARRQAHTHRTSGPPSCFSHDR